MAARAYRKQNGVYDLASIGHLFDAYLSALVSNPGLDSIARRTNPSHTTVVAKATT